MVYAGTFSYAYFGGEGSGEGLGDPSSDQNIPFNPTKALSPQKPKYNEAEEYTFDSLVPNIVYTDELVPGEGPIEFSFRDPFFLLKFFTHKTVGGVWGTGTGTIDADFSEIDDKETMWIQYHLHDQSGSANHINKLLKNIHPQKYSWVIEANKLLKEIGDLKCLAFATNTQAMACSNNFHDQRWGSGVGGWGNWDDSGLNGTGKRSVVNMVLQWGGAALTALKMTGMTLSFEVGSESIQTVDALGHTVSYYKVRAFYLTVTGLLNDLTAIAEAEKIYSDKTKQTCRLYYDFTTDEEKYLQFTNAYISSKESDIAAIPEAGKSTEVTYVIRGGEETAASFSGKFVDLPDPTALIKTSP